MVSNTAPRLRRALAVLIGLAVSTAVLAQLKPPGSGRPGLSTAPSAPSAPAATSAPSASAPAPQAQASAPASDTQAMEDAGRAAATGWLLLLDRRDWGSAWENAAASFRKNVPLEAWMKGIPESRADLGPLVERTVVRTLYSSQVEGEPPGDYVSIVFDSRFERRQLQEALTTVRERDGRWRVMGYAVQ